MAEPSRKIEQDFLRLAADSFDMSFTPEMELELERRNLDLFDIQNVLADCLVKWSNKEDARGSSYGVAGVTTEGDHVMLELWIDADQGIVRLDRVLCASGANGDANDRTGKVASQ